MIPDFLAVALFRCTRQPTDFVTASWTSPGAAQLSVDSLALLLLALAIQIYHGGSSQQHRNVLYIYAGI